MKLFKMTILLSLLAIGFVANSQTLPKGSYFTECNVKEKCSDFNLYMTSVQANEAKEKFGSKVVFLDVRTLEEINLIGTPKSIDGYAQYYKLDELNSFDKKKKAILSEPNSQFGMSVDHFINKNGFTKETPLILICRSGSRSAAAASLLKKAGYKEVYSVFDGFEGDLDKKGHRSLDGWKNKGFDYTFEISPTLNLAE